MFHPNSDTGSSDQRIGTRQQWRLVLESSHACVVVQIHGVGCFSALVEVVNVGTLHEVRRIMIGRRDRSGFVVLVQTT